ncbi:MAG: type II secretion system major pseudopilin GspG [Luteolibacter sp.]|jgi:general secretion pathway protein G
MKIHRSRPASIHRSGFTLLEMVIVLGIIAMILGGAIFAMRGIGDAAKLKQVDADFKSLESALALYRMNAGQFPSTQQGLKALVDRPSGSPEPRQWVQVMSNVPKDPWDAEYRYQYPGSRRANHFEIISNGPDGLPNTGDDISSQAE